MFPSMEEITIIDATLDEQSKPIPTNECTACLTTILGKADARLHNDLGCIVCSQCHLDYNQNLVETRIGGGFSLNERGHQNRCRLCCGHKYLIACTSHNYNNNTRRCRYAFCQSCIQRYDSEAEILKVYREDPDQYTHCKWACFVCDKDKQKHFRSETAKYLEELHAYYPFDELIDIRDQGKNNLSVTDQQLDSDDMESNSPETETVEQLKPNDTPGRASDDDASADKLPDSSYRSYRKSNWSIVSHHIEPKLDFRIVWDGFSDFETLESVEFVMANFEKTRSYLKIVKATDCYKFDAIIKKAPQLAEVFRASVSSGSNSEHNQVRNIDKLSSRLRRKIEGASPQKNQSSEVTMDKFDHLSSTSSKRKSDQSQSDAPNPPAKRKTNGNLPAEPITPDIPQKSQIIVSEATTSRTSSDQAKEKSLNTQKSTNLESNPVEVQSNKPTAPIVNKAQLNKSRSITSDTSEVSANFASVPTIASPTNIIRAQEAAPSLNSERSEMLWSPSIVGNGSKSQRRKEPEKTAPEGLPPPASTTTNIMPRASIIVSPNTPTLIGKTVDHNYREKSTETELNIVDSTETASMLSKEHNVPSTEQNASSAKLNAPPTEQNVSVVLESKIEKQSEKTVAMSDESQQLDAQSVSQKKVSENSEIHTSTRTDLINKPATPSKKSSKSHQPHANVTSARTSINAAQQTYPNSSKERDTDQPLATQPSKRDSLNQAHVRSLIPHPRSTLSSVSNSNKNGRKDLATSDRSKQVTNLADILPIDRVAPDYKIPKLNKGDQTCSSSTSPKNQSQPINSVHKASTESVQQQEHVITGTSVSENRNKKSYPDKSAPRNTCIDLNPINKQTPKIAPESNSRSDHGFNKQPLKSRRADSTTQFDHKKPVFRDSSASSMLSESKVNRHGSTCSRDSHRFSRLGEFNSRRRSISPTSVAHKTCDDRFQSKISRRSPSNESKSDLSDNHDSDYQHRPESPQKMPIPTIVRTLLRHLSNYSPRTREENREQNNHWVKQSQLYPKDRNCNQMLAGKAYNIRGGLKYLGMDKEKHEAGIQAIIQCSRHKLLYDKERQTVIAINVFEVKFWGHDEADKLPFSEVIEGNFIAVKKFFDAIKKYYPNRYKRWVKDKSVHYILSSTESPKVCHNYVAQMERAAYNKYLRLRLQAKHY